MIPRTVINQLHPPPTRTGELRWTGSCFELLSAGVGTVRRSLLAGRAELLDPLSPAVFAQRRLALEAHHPVLGVTPQQSRRGFLSIIRQETRREF